MSLSGTSLPNPKNWQDFETKMRELFVCVLNDPFTQKNGRSGQPQHGVDIYGYRDSNCNSIVGIQCKKKFKDIVTEIELRSEVENVKKFKPKIDEFILATTAPRDQKIQETARIITEELAKTDHPIRVSVWGWDDIEENAANYEKAWKAFEPTWDPINEGYLKKILAETQEIKQHIVNNSRIQILDTVISTNISDGKSIVDNNENTLLHIEIKVLQQLTDDGYASETLQRILKLKEEKWETADRNERYRILICIASAKLKLGEIIQAANLLQDAYDECPEHKNARKNLAMSYLFKKDNIKAKKLACEMLLEDTNNDKAAGILIQAHANDVTCDDPLKDVPKVLYETEEVFIALVQFHRERENPDWVKIAHSGIQKHPDSSALKILSAVATLDEIIINDFDMILGGIAKKIEFKEFREAVELLYTEAHDAIDKKYTLHSSIAYNTSLGLRLLKDITRAKEILEYSLKQYPDDENLCVQRALIALIENDLDKVQEILSESSSNPEVKGLLANAMLSAGKVDDALSLIDEIDERRIPDHLKADYYSTRISAYIKLNKKQLAIQIITQCIDEEPNNISFRIMKIRTYLMIGDTESANNVFKEALSLINDQTNLLARIELSFEARKLNHYAAIVSLLKDKVALDRKSEGLQLLIEALINSEFRVTTHDILNSISQDLRNEPWFKKAEIILALKTGDIDAEKKINQYLKKCPYDLDMILNKIGILQRERENEKIHVFLQHLNLSKINGRPEHRIQLAFMIYQYEDVLRGLKFAYSVLMNNWDVPQAHLAYMGLLLLHENIEIIKPTEEFIAENTVTCLLTKDGERRYRIEKEKHVFFEEERLSPENELALLLIGKKVGEKFKLQKQINSISVEVRWIKSIYIDILHRSMERFNEMFPSAEGLQRFNFDPNVPKPFEEIAAMTKSRAEANQQMLKEYKSNGFPLSFVSKYFGIDPLDVYNGLSAVNIKFQVCVGFTKELNDAVQVIYNHKKKGCILDVITLSIIHRLGIEKAVAAVCGPIYTTQSVIDLMALRAIEASLKIGKKQGFLSWHMDHLIYDEYSEETIKNMANELDKEAIWARNVALIAPAMPKKDFSQEVKRVIEMFDPEAYDPAIASEGKDLILLSEDMGFRTWSKEAFGISTTWLQPVLRTALSEGYLTSSEYCEAINLLVLSGHTYVSLDTNCLIHEARKNDFILTKELSCLFEMVGGILADLQINSGVLANFIDLLCIECDNELKIMRIISEIFSTFIKGRQEDQQQIITLILTKIKIKKDLVEEHALNWLIGHSIGTPFFNELLQIKKGL